MPPAVTTSFAPWEHMIMLSDRIRVHALRQGIAQYADREKVFCDLGCGTGVFSIHAARLYDRVIAVDRDPRMLAIADENARRHGVRDRLTLIQADAETLSAAALGTAVDVLFCEMLSTWLINEGQVPVLNQALAHLVSPKAVLIPLSVTNLIELAWFDYDFDGIRLCAPCPEFANIRMPQLLSNSVVSDNIDLNRPIPLRVTGSVRLSALADGVVNCLRLSNIVHVAPGVSCYGTNSMMPAFLVPTNNILTVSRSMLVEIGFSLAFGGGYDEARFSVVAIDRASI
jgi:predicted RNA methylase